LTRVPPVAAATGAVGGVALAQLPSSQHGRVVQVPADIADNCSVDVTLKLDAWLQGLPNGTTASLQTGACYRVNGTLAILGKTHFTLLGNGARIEAVTLTNPFRAARHAYPGSNAPDQRRDLVIVDSSDVTVSGLTIQGPDKSGRYLVPYANENGIQVNLSTRVLVEHVSVSDTYGDGMVITGNSTNVTFEHDSVPLAGRNSISDYAGSEVTIADNTLGPCHFIHFDIEPFLVNGQARAAQEVLITHNTLTGHGGFFSDIGAANAVVNDLELSYNTVSSVIGVQVGGGKGSIKERANILVLCNHGLSVANDTVRALMNFASVDGVTVSGNVQSFSPATRTIAVLISNSTDVVVSGNTFPHVKDVLSTGQGMSLKLARRASSGQSSLWTSATPRDLVSYRLGTGGNAQTITLVTYRGTGSVDATLGQNLRSNYPAGTRLVLAPSSDYLQSDNSIG
jgi:hypothetical protein